MNNKVYSSSASGYIILPKLVDSTYIFQVGFPQHKWPDQGFSVTLNRQDHGYLLKNFKDKGWGLYDLQTMAVQMSIGSSPEELAKKQNKDGASFTDILAKAADDPSLKEKPVQPKVEEKKPEVVKKEEPKVEEKKTEVVKKEEPKVEEKKLVVVKKEEPKVEIKEPVTTKPVEEKDVWVTKKEEPKVEKTEPVVVKTEPTKEEPKAEIKEEQVVRTEEKKTTGFDPYKTSQVKKWSESSTTEGFGLVFIDDYLDGNKDTIRLVIPNPKPIVNVIKEEPKEEKKFLEIETPAKEEKPVVTEEKRTEEKTTEPVVTVPATGKKALTNNCVELATESDFFKLRKKMAAEDKEDNMIAEAKKYFKTKCFTTAQVKNLSTLFLSDESKYDFFDLAYKYVSDTEAFPGLQAELKDEYYSSRFKAMLRN